MSQLKEKKKLTYRIFLFICSLFLKTVFSLKIEGRKNIPLSGPVIFIANHMTNLDPFVVAVSLSERKLNSLAKEELFKSPLKAAFFRKIGVIPIARGKYDRETIKKSLNLLSLGEALALFPEGTRQQLGKGRVGPFHEGAALMSIMSGAEVIPLAIIGTDEAWPKGSKFFRSAKIRVIIGEKVERCENRKEYTEKMRQAIIGLLAEAYDEN